MSDAVERTIEIEADPDEVWELLVDDDERSAWFGGPTTLEPVPGGPGTFTDPDGGRRDAVVEEIEPGRRLSWTWWSDDGEDRSRVDIELAPTTPGRPGAPTIGTRVTVVETPTAAPAVSMSLTAGQPDHPGRLRLRGLDLRGLELHAMLRVRAPAWRAVA